RASTYLVLSRPAVPVLSLPSDVLRAHPGAPPFPPRRSSDLAGQPRALQADVRRGLPGRLAAQPSDPSAADARLRDHEGKPRIPRSEEHTSELQSRENLVCRLLLEKTNEPY